MMFIFRYYTQNCLYSSTVFTCYPLVTCFSPILPSLFIFSPILSYHAPFSIICFPLFFLSQYFSLSSMWFKVTEVCVGYGESTPRDYVDHFKLFIALCKICVQNRKWGKKVKTDPYSRNSLCVYHSLTCCLILFKAFFEVFTYMAVRPFCSRASPVHCIQSADVFSHYS